MRVYIAGPMTGLPLFNFPAFDYAAAQWADAGWEVVSPADLTRKLWRERFGTEFDPSSTDPAISAGGDIYRDFLREDIREIVTCDAIALLPGWRKSKGAAVELTVARAMKCQVLDAVTFKPMPDESALEEAQRLVHGDRGVDYGHPIDDFSRTAAIWSAILGVPVTAEQVGLCMIGVKLSRQCNRPKRDNMVDAAGYAETVQMVIDERDRRGRQVGEIRERMGKV